MTHISNPDGTKGILHGLIVTINTLSQYYLIGHLIFQDRRFGSFEGANAEIQQQKIRCSVLSWNENLLTLNI